MIYILNFFVLLFLSIITVSFLPHLLPYSLAPILPLSFIVIFSYLRKGFEPVILAAFSGFFLDIFASANFGVYTIIFLLTAVFIRVVFHEGMKRISFFRYITINTIVLLVLFLTELLILFFLEVPIVSISTLASFGRFFLFNLLGATALYWLVIKYLDKIEILEVKRKKV